jgi:ferrochelatase
VGLYGRALCTAPADGNADARLPFTIDFVENWHNYPLLIRAFAQRLREGWQRACAEAGSRLPVIFTAHSVPLRTIAEGDPYEVQTRETAALVADCVPEVARGEWRFAFQSQGMSGGEWLGPTVEETMLALKAAGQTGVFLQPIGFVCDHVEILYDIDIAFRRFAEEKGLRLWRAESLNDSPAFIQAVAALAAERLRGAVTASHGVPGGGQQP